MRTYVIAIFLSVSVPAGAQQPKTVSPLRAVLLQELRETHNQKNWFVSEKKAVAGLTPEQAVWSDGKNHSVGQLVQHLNYWNAANLAKFTHQTVRQVAENDETFTFNVKEWKPALKEFDQTMGELEKYVQSLDETTLEKIAPTIALIAQHNAYHIGEMVTSRKKQGSWNPEMGVK
jgi:DinB family protein